MTTIVCEKAGPKLDASDEFFYRQVPEAWIDQGEPTSQAFYPWRDVDDGCLSVDRASRTTAGEAFKLFTDPKPVGFGMPSSGVWSLSFQELEAASLTGWEDEVGATDTTPCNHAHAVIDFAPHDEKVRKKIGKKLKALTHGRGRVHPVRT